MSTSSLAQSLARSLNTRTSLESVDVDVNIGKDALLDEDGATVSSVAPATDEPIIEAQQTELAEEESNMGDTETSADEAEDDIETLESIQLALENTLHRGGMDTVSYEMFGITMDHIYRKYGISSSNVLPSMESFNYDNHGQTVVSLEKVRASLGAISESVGQLIKKLWFQLKNFVTNMVKMNFSQTKRVQAILNKAKTINDTRTTGDLPMIKLHSANKLHINGKIPNKAVVIKSFDSTALALSQLETISKSFFDTITSDIDAGLRSRHVEGGEKYISSELVPFTKLNDRIIFQDAKFELKNEDSKVFSTGVKLATTKMEKRGDDSDDYKIVPLTSTEVERVCNKLLDSITAVNVLSKYATTGSLEKKVIALSSFVGPSSKKANKALSESVDVDKDEIKGLRIRLKLAISTHGKLLNYISGINKAMTDYCVQSLDAIISAGKANAKTQHKNQYTNTKY